MSRKLDIGASMQRRQAPDAAPRRADDPGESAWELAERQRAAADAEAWPAHRNDPADPLAAHSQAAADADSHADSDLGADDHRGDDGASGRRAQAFGRPSNGEDRPGRGSDDGFEDDDEPAAQTPAFPMLPGFGDDEDEGPSGPGLDIMRFVRGILKRWWIVALSTIVLTGLFLMLALSLPRAWEAQTTLITQTHQDEFKITAQPGFRPQDYDLSTFIDTIKLPSSIDETMRRLDIDVLRGTMAAAIDVGVGKDSKIFFIRAKWDDPHMAAAIANTVAELFIENSAQIRRRENEAAFDYYSSQLREARAELDRAGAELLSFEKTHRIASLDSQLAVLVSQISTLDAQFQINVAEIGAMRATLKRISATLQDEPEMIVTATRYFSPLKQRLTDYEWELNDARTRYTDENPKIVRLAKRIEALRSLIAENSDEAAPENTYELNPKRQDLSAREQELIDELRITEAQTEALKGTLDESRAELAKLTAARTGHEELEARVRDAERLATHLSARVDEVRVFLERDDSGFNILEPATVPTLPLPSMRKVVAAAGLVLGSGLGLFIALVLELLDPLVRTRRDVIGITGCELVLEFQAAPSQTSALIDHVVPTAPVSVLFRRIVNDLQTSLAPKEWRSLAITSADAGCGRTLFAANLASALGLKDEMTLLVDADVRADAGPRPSALVGLDQPFREADITDVLAGGTDPEVAFEPTVNPFVRLLNAGDHQTDNGLLLLGSRGFKDLAKRFARERGHVIYDLPPLEAMESVGEAAAAVGNVMLVARSGHTRRADLKRITEMLAAREVPLRAAAITMVPEDLLSQPPVFRKAKSRGLFGRMRRAAVAGDNGRDSPLVVDDDVGIR
ncbi:MAG: hypothetical protein K9M02_14010 [Thiohalocapsa sp.]|nr:hypothetical protein [Thiohalocapsa sp.]